MYTYIYIYICVFGDIGDHWISSVLTVKGYHGVFRNLQLAGLQRIKKTKTRLLVSGVKQSVPFFQSQTPSEFHYLRCHHQLAVRHTLCDSGGEDLRTMRSLWVSGVNKMDPEVLAFLLPKLFVCFHVKPCLVWSVTQVLAADKCISFAFA